MKGDVMFYEHYLYYDKEKDCNVDDCVTWESVTEWKNSMENEDNLILVWSHLFNESGQLVASYINGEFKEVE